MKVQVSILDLWLPGCWHWAWRGYYNARGIQDNLPCLISSCKPVSRRYWAGDEKDSLSIKALCQKLYFSNLNDHFPILELQNPLHDVPEL